MNSKLLEASRIQRCILLIKIDLSSASMACGCLSGRKTSAFEGGDRMRLAVVRSKGVRPRPPAKPESFGRQDHASRYYFVFGIRRVARLAAARQSLPFAKAATILLLLAACSRYEPLPLPVAPRLAATVGALSFGTQPVPSFFGVAAISSLALLNNPDLVAGRRQHSVAQAQLLAAGVLPNPVLSASFLPLAAGIPGTAGAPATANAAATPAQSVTPAYSIGLSYDIRSLLTLGHRHAAARAAAFQVDAQLLWQEWQTVGQARLLAVDLMTGTRSLALLVQERDLLAARSRLTQRAAASGDVTVAALAPDLAALSTVETAVNDGERLVLLRRHQLNALLGLLPDAEVALAKTPDMPPLNVGSVLRDLETLSRRRPDLVALQYGYQSEDARLRTAILGQFPNLAVGLVGGSDNANVRNIGPQASIDLPIFDRNQGNIAIERSTRLQLRDEYAARLAAAYGQVRATLGEIAQSRAQLDRARLTLAPLRRMETAARAALRAGSLDERSTVDFITARLNRAVEIAALEQLLIEQQVALETLTGAGLPPLTLPPPAAASENVPS